MKRARLRLHNTIAFQFLTSFILFSILILALLVTHTFFAFQKSQESAEQIPTLIAEKMSGDLSHFFVQTQNNLRLASLGFTDTLVPELIVQDILDTDPSIISIDVFDLGGIEQLHVNRPTIEEEDRTPETVLGQLFFEAGRLGEEHFGNPFISAYKIPFVHWSFPILNEDKGVIGVMRATLDLSVLWETVSEPDRGIAYVVDASGNLLVWQNLQLLERQDNFNNFQSVRAFLDRDEGVFDYAGLRGNRVLGSWKAIEPTPWAVIAEVSFEEIFEEAYVSLLLLLSLIAVVVIAVVYIILFFDRNVLMPISALRSGISAFGDGDFSTRIRTRSKNEFGILARTFNTMAERIADEPKRLQEEVNRRTEELRQANERLNQLVNEIHENSKVLIQKDKELVKANDEMMTLNKEMDAVGKILVKRDRELTEANNRLQQLDTVKSEFVSVAAHQLRTPLTGIRWTLRGLSAGEFGDLSADQARAAKNGLAATDIAVELINDLLDTARIEGGRFGFAFVVGPLKPVIDSVIERLKSKAENKGVELVPPVIGDDVFMALDDERLGIAIENAVENAIKYTTPPGKVTLTAEVDEKNIKLVVADSGIGIPEDQQHRLFSKFFRAQNAVLLQTAGTGLGLYMMKSIVEKHEGTVSIESEVDVGTKVIFNFPRAKEGEEPKIASDVLE